MKTATRSNKTSETARLQERVYRTHQQWIKNNGSATLTDLRQFLQDVSDEFYTHDGDNLIADYFHGLGDAADYLSEFADPTKDGEEPVTFEYRLANVEEDIWHIEDLIKLVGDSFKLKNLLRKNNLATS